MRQRWLLIAAILAIPALIYFGRQVYLERTRAAQQLTAWEHEQQIERRLEQLVDIPVGEGLPWRDWASEFTRQTGLEVSFRDEEYLNGLRVSRDAKRQPARVALDVLAEGTRGHWYLERGHICLAPLDDEGVPPTDIRTYALEPSIPPAGKRQMEELLRATMFPLSRLGAADYGELIDVPGQFVIAQNHRDQTRIAQIWPRLQTCLRDAELLPALGLDPNDAQLASVVLDAPSERRDALQAALAQPFSLDVQDVPLKDVVGQIADRTGLTIVFPMRLEAEGIMPDAPMTLKMSDKPLQTVLQRLLRPFGLIAVPSTDYRQLQLVTPWEARGQFPLRAFPIPDFSDPHDQSGLLRLYDSIESPAWQGRQGHGGSASLHFQGKLLIVSLDDDSLQRFERLLWAVRTVRTGRQRWASAEVVSVGSEDAQHPRATESQVLDTRALLASRRCSHQDLQEILIASVDRKFSTDRNAASIVEFQGLFVVNHRPELRTPIRHALAAIERHYFAAPAQRERGNLAAVLPDQSNPKSPQIYVYAVEDLLAERDALWSHHFKYDLQTTTLKRSVQGDDLPMVFIRGNRFLIAHLYEDQVAPLEAKLRTMREPAATE